MIVLVAALCSTAVQASAQQAPQPKACSGFLQALWPGIGGPNFTLEASGVCGLHRFSFSGEAAPDASANLCSPEASSLSFVGTEQEDNAPAVTATWTLTGTDTRTAVSPQQAEQPTGLFAVTATRPDGSARIGAAVANDCFPGGGVFADLWVGGVTNGPVRADVYSCHATATVNQGTPDFGSAFGEMQGGAGTCRSSRGAWQATVAALWDRTLDEPLCQGGEYNVYALDLTRAQSTVSFSQIWSSPASLATNHVGGISTPLPPRTTDHRVNLITSQASGTPIGIGRVQESPDSCSSTSSPFQVTADWVFVDE